MDTLDHDYSQANPGSWLTVAQNEVPRNRKRVRQPQTNRFQIALQPPVIPEPYLVSLCLSILNGFFCHFFA